jgi:plastocyanin
MRTRWVVTVLAASLAITASACSDDSNGAIASGVSTIAVRDYEFEPEAVSVEGGERITWVWEGQAQHNVVGDGFESPTQNTGSFRHTFDQAGTFPYACTVHPGMEGEVVVEAGG